MSASDITISNVTVSSITLHTEGRMPDGFGPTFFSPGAILRYTPKEFLSSTSGQGHTWKNPDYRRELREYEQAVREWNSMLRYEAKISIKNIGREFHEVRLIAYRQERGEVVNSATIDFGTIAPNSLHASIFRMGDRFNPHTAYTRGQASNWYLGCITVDGAHNQINVSLEPNTPIRGTQPRSGSLWRKLFGD
jgi:hypothetical protein